MLASGQPERMRPRRGARPGRNRPDAALAHGLPGDPGGGRRAEVGEDAQRLAQRGFLVRTRAGPAPPRTGSPARSSGPRPAPSRRRPAADRARPARPAAGGRNRCAAARRRSRRAPRRRRPADASSASSASRRGRRRPGPASQYASARASRTGTICDGSAVPSADRIASSRCSQAPGSPRRARIVPRLISGLIRLTGEAPLRVEQLPAQRDRLVPPAELLQGAGLLAAQADPERPDVVLVAVGDAVREVRFGLGEPPLAAVQDVEVGERPARPVPAGPRPPRSPAPGSSGPVQSPPRLARAQPRC